MASCHSIAEFTLDGISLGPYSFASIDLLPAGTVSITNQIAVYIGGNLQTLTTDYTVDEGNTRITLIEAQTSGDVLSIRRETKVDARYVDFINGAVVSEQVMDLDSDQLFFLIQENFCDLSNTLRLLGNCWNGQGFTTCNFAAGTTSNSLTTLGQVLDLIKGIGSINVGATNYVTYTGDGVETEFDFDAFNLTQVPPTHDMFVTVDNILQDSGVAFSTVLSGANMVVKFGTPPVSGTIITIRSLTGAVISSVQPGSIPGQNIKDNSLDISKIFDNIDDFTVWDGLTGTVVLVAEADNLSPHASSTQFTPSVLKPTMLRNFNPAVQANRLDQMGAPTNQVNFNSQRLTGVLTDQTVVDPTQATNKAYVDAAIAAVGNPTASFLEATAFETIEASVDGLSGSTTVRARSGTVLVPWGNHPGPLMVRIFASYTGNTVYTPGNEFNHTIHHWDQGSNTGSGSGFAGDGLVGTWEGLYTDATGYFIAPQAGFAGYRINTGASDLYLWLNVTDTQIEWELAGPTKNALTDSDEFFQIRMAFWRKEF